MAGSSLFGADGSAETALMGLIGGGIGFLFIPIFLFKRVLNCPTDNGGPVEKLAGYVERGAKAFLKREYTALVVFVALMSAVVGGVTEDYGTVLCFYIGALLSGACGWLGMYVATKANVRTCQAAKTGLNEALQVAFSSGAVMGLSTVSIGLLGVTVSYLIGKGEYFTDSMPASYLAGFGFGASSIALFARVGGGIYTKAADVGADLVGKVEAGIPEDDARNPATIADNVGDNVGDVAGMGADLFESFVGSIIATIQLSYYGYTKMIEVENCGEANASSDCADWMSADSSNSTQGMYLHQALPFWISGFGILVSILGVFFVRTSNNVPQEHLGEKLLFTIRRALGAAAVLASITALISCIILFGSSDWAFRLWGCTLIGLVSGVGIGYFTEYATAFEYEPTRSISKQAFTGPATVVIQGLGVGYLSVFPPAVIIFFAILIVNELCGVYGIAIAAVGMLSTLGVTLATDAFGPVADNAGGLAEMAELPSEVRDRTDGLDALGNTTAATGKGFAIGSAVLSALALMVAFVGEAGINGINVLNAPVMAGAIFGAMLPYIFAALTMLAVGRSAQAMIVEVRRQFREIAGIMDRTTEPEYEKCVDISTSASLKEMVVPGVLAITSPLFVGFLLGPEALGGMLVGGITSGFMLAVSMANSGGAWDNAKKWVEAEGLGSKADGLAKGSEIHAAVVTGDTIGDPFKDTSGPSLNILIKLMSMIALVFAPKMKGEAEWDLWYVALVIALITIIFIVAFNKFVSAAEIDFKAEYMKALAAKRGVELEDVDVATKPEAAPATNGEPIEVADPAVEAEA